METIFDPRNIRKSFIDRLDAISSDLYGGLVVKDKWHTGLNSLYGCEIEFYHFDYYDKSYDTGNKPSRFSLGNKVNNCIFKQNSDDFYRYSLDPLSSTETIEQQQGNQPPGSGNGITNSSNFNEWTNFMVEVSKDYHAPTHKGIPERDLEKNNRGLSGFKIETDDSVTFNYRYNELKKNPSNLPPDYKKLGLGNEYLTDRDTDTDTDTDTENRLNDMFTVWYSNDNFKKDVLKKSFLELYNEESNKENKKQLVEDYIKRYNRFATFYEEKKSIEKEKKEKKEEKKEEDEDQKRGRLYYEEFLRKEEIKKNAERNTILTNDDFKVEKFDDILTTVTEKNITVKAVDVYTLLNHLLVVKKKMEPSKYPNDENFPRIVDKTELVTPILTNEPFILHENKVPYGFLAIDNMVNHLTSHDNVLFVYNEGLHLHMSKNPRTPPNLRGKLHITPEEAVGLCKLFWVFEPLFFAAQPTFKSENLRLGYQSIQSLFNYNEILCSNGVTYEDIYYILLLSDDINTTDKFPKNRRYTSQNSTGHKGRYLSLNFINLLFGGIGTVELRLGYGTFDSNAIQLFIHMFQILFELNLTLCRLSETKKKENYHFYHDQIIIESKKRKVLPFYTTTFTSEEYNEVPQVWYNSENFPYIEDNDFETLNTSVNDTTNKGTPLLGFIRSIGIKETTTDLINGLCTYFFDLTGAKDAILEVVKYINIYHSGKLKDNKVLHGYPDIFRDDINVVGLDLNLSDDQPLLPFKSFLMFRDYVPNDKTKISSLNEECNTCYTNKKGVCAEIYDDATAVHMDRDFHGQYEKNIRNQHYAYRDSDEDDFTCKVQTELLNSKLESEPVSTSGGRRKLKTRKLKTRKLKTRKLKTRKLKTRKIKTRKHKTRKYKSRKLKTLKNN